MVYVKVVNCIDPNMAALSHGCKPRIHHAPVFHFDWNVNRRERRVLIERRSVTSSYHGSQISG